MEIIELSNPELFISLLDLNVGKKNFDLHNDYTFKEFNFSTIKNEISLIFSEDISLKEVKIFFTDIIILELELPIGVELGIDNFYRGRYEYEDKLYDEFLQKKCYYIDLYENGKINLLAEKLFLVI
ncbi:MAG: hypothetical protein WD512_01335 [Candidatus Paceibacterota bacterium]